MALPLPVFAKDSQRVPDPILEAIEVASRRSKVLVALNLLPSNWRVVDEDADYGIRETRQLLIDLIGGGPGEQFRDQFR